MRGLAGLQRWLYPFAVQLVRQFPQLQVTSVRRSYYQQLALYQAALAGASRYPAARPGYSYHELGRAFDLVGPHAILQAAGQTWESWGGEWGARFGDPIHFQA